MAEFGESTDLIPIESNPLTRPDGIDPGEKVADFLATLLKAGGVRDFSYCTSWCRREGIDLERDILRVFPITKIRKARTGGKDGTLVVWLIDLPWADNWARYYDTQRGHHKHIVPRKEI